jgi:ribosomal-protein-alanine N-acetyltransferase
VRIDLSGGYALTGIEDRDREAHLRLLTDGTIAAFIPAIPQPYTEESADKWVRHRIAFAQAGVEICFAIRDPQGRMVGSVGVDDLQVGKAHNGELGYWLAPAARGQGLATEAVRAFIPYAFGPLGLERLTAHTLHFNDRSIRVLERNGFAPEGRLRRFTRTATGLRDVLVFGLLREP